MLSLRLLYEYIEKFIMLQIRFFYSNHFANSDPLSDTKTLTDSGLKNFSSLFTFVT